MKYKMFLVGLVFLGGCSSGGMAQLGSIGARHHIVCYSGNTKIYEGYSPGMVHNQDRSDGFYFQDEKTKLLVEVSGNCVITQEGRGESSDIVKG